MRDKVLLLLYFTILSLLFLHPINSGDFFHHLATGRDIVKTFSLPYTDTWSFTAYGKPWVAHSWGAGVLFYFVYKMFGAIGISVLFAIFGALTGLFLFLILQRLQGNTLLSLILTWLASSLVSLRWPTRPEVFGPLFVTTLLFLMMDYTKRFMAIGLPLFFWVWGIVYGSSVFLGIGILAFYLLVTKKRHIKDFGLLGASFLASLLNGYGLKSFLYITKIPTIASYVGEWLPMTATLNPQIPEVVLFYQYPILAYGIFVVIFIAMLLFTTIKNRKILSPNLFLLGIASGVFAPLYTVRFLNLAPLLAIPILALLITSLPKRAMIILLFLLTALALFASWVRFENFTFGKGQDTQFDRRVTDYLKKRNINGNIFTSQEVGGFIAFELPKSKIFVDTRDDLYQPLGIFRDLQMLTEGKLNILNLLAKYHAHIVVGEVANETYKPLFYTNGWELIYLSDNFFIAVKKELRLKYQLQPFEAIDPLRVPPAKPGELKEAKKELEKLAKEEGTTENKIRLAEVLLSLGETKEAVKIIERVNLSGFFGSRQSLVELGKFELLARFYLTAKECDKAEITIKEADKRTRNQLIFFPRVRLTSAADFYLGEYYLTCKNDKEKAKSYFLEYLRQTPSAIERKRIEEKIEMIDN